MNNSPTNISKIYEILSRIYPTFNDGQSDWEDGGLSASPFHSLISVCLSTMTKTSRVVEAGSKLYRRANNFYELLALPDDELREMIKSVAHYNRKTIHLKEMARQIIDNYHGKVPASRDELMKLKGVGRKVVDIMMNFVFSEDSIAVDTHVLRVLNRLEIVKTKSAEKAADLINEITPKKYKKHAHEWLIQHGMNICKAIKPKCNICDLRSLCNNKRTCNL
jgi:endonuclease-3